MFPDEAPLTQGCASAWYSITSPETLRSGLDKALSQDKRCSVMTSWRAVLDSGLFFKGRWCFCMTWAHKVLETLKLYAPEWDWECCWCLGSFCCGKLWLETPNIAFICHTIQPYSFKKKTPTTTNASSHLSFPNWNRLFVSFFLYISLSMWCTQAQQSGQTCHELPVSHLFIILCTVSPAAWSEGPKCQF